MADDARPIDLPAPFAGWFSERGWTPRAHQLALLAEAQAGRSALLIAPTGGGKTLAGFLPSLIELAAVHAAKPLRRPHALHTLYISPLKALTVDVARNLIGPAQEMGLPLRIETRTGDTPLSRRARQRAHPPDILLTTPEQVALILSSEHADAFFADLKAVIVDEAHALAPTKRGDLLALCLARLSRFAPLHRRIGLSATVAEPAKLAAWLTGAAAPSILFGAPGAVPDVEVLDSDARIPWAGHTGRHAIHEVYEAIGAARTALVFVNTRAQAELTFQELWRVNEDNLPIALHHGSLDVEQRRKVEAAMARGDLRGIVCTSTLDLGIDWGEVDLVIQMGAPKGCSRLIQRIGRANHRLDEPSRALLVPNSRFEVLECRAAQAAVIEGALDGEVTRSGALDVLAQHIMGCACGAPFLADDLYTEIIQAAPYAALTRERFHHAFELVATGGYALANYERYRRIVQLPDGRWRVRNAEIARRHRMNVGAIVEAAMLNVRLSARGRPGRRLGQIEESFIEALTPGDTFVFAGEILRFDALINTDVLVSRDASAEAPKIPSYAGGKFPLSTFLADRVRRLIHDQNAWASLPDQAVEWLRLQQERSIIPQPDHLLVETFARGPRHHLVCYPFDGRLAHQTLGMLLTRRLERLRKKPLGFVASEYALAVYGLEPMSDVDMQALFAEDMLGDDLDAWLAESALMKRTFRNCAIIAGLIEKKSPGAEKSGRQVTFSADLIYDVLRKHEPDHILMQAAFEDAAANALDVRRLGDLLRRVSGKISAIDLDHISPFAVPMMIEIGRERIDGEARDAILEEVGAELLAEAAAR